MKNSNEIIKSLYKQAELFRSEVKRKNWPIAKAIYETCRTVAVFVAIDQEKMVDLFGDGQQAGLFSQANVQKCYYEVAVKRQSEDKVQKQLAEMIERHQIPIKMEK